MSNRAPLRKIDDNGNEIRYDLGSKLNLYCLFDRIAGNFLPLFQANNDLVATREFRTVANNKVTGNTIATNTEDYDLYQVGTWDPRSGSIESITPMIVASGTQLLNPNKEPK